MAKTVLTISVRERKASGGEERGGIIVPCLGSKDVFFCQVCGSWISSFLLGKGKQRLGGGCCLRGL